MDDDTTASHVAGTGSRLLVHQTPLEGALVVTPQTFPDDRGLFYESWNHQHFAAAVGRDLTFVQDNHSRSRKGVIRGLHYQNPHPQGKLIMCVAGAIWDAIVDLRRSSTTYGGWFGIELSAADSAQLWVPEGFAHGFLTLSDSTDVIYKTTDYYYPEAEHTVRWDDPSIDIEWPLNGIEPLLSPKDAAAPGLDGAKAFG